MRLIDANRLLKELYFIAREQFSLSDEYGKFIHTLIKVEELICEQPIVDVAEEVIRCKDCIHYRKDEVCGERAWETCKLSKMVTYDTGFCCWGERIEE